VLLLILSMIFGITAAGAVDVLSGYSQVLFIENKGQVAESVRFIVNSPTLQIYFTDEGEIFYTQASGEVSAVSVYYQGANPGVTISSGDLLSGRANYLLGDDSNAWVSNVPMYSSITYDDIYPGIDLRYTGGDGLLEREFIVSPGAVPDTIIMQYSGMKNIALDDFSGSLIISTSTGDLIETAPVCYQVIKGGRIDVPCKYVVDDAGKVSFAVGAYEKNSPLIIDPVVDFSTYYGGNFDDVGNGIDLDDQGDVYITGATISTNIPLPNAPVFQEHLNGTWDAFVAKFSSDGTLVYATYIGGNSTDKAAGIAVIRNTSLASGGRATITGYTDSLDYPNIAADQPLKSNFSDVFITRLNADGDNLIWSTFLGGNETDQATGIALTTGGAPVIVGFTGSADFPVSGGATWPNGDSYSGGFDAFMARYNNAGIRQESHFLGGNGTDYAYGVALDAANRIYITGSTRPMLPNLFPTVPGSYRVTPQGRTDAFITKMNAAGNSLIYSTYLGGTKDDVGLAIDVDLNNYTYIAGWTESAVQPIENFPISINAFQKIFGGGSADAFVSKLEPAGDKINYSTYLGGNFQDQANGIAVDNRSEAHVVGFTVSDNFPVTANAFQPVKDGLVSDCFLTEFNATGKTLIFSTYWGGTYYDVANDIAISPDGLNITFTGFTESLNFPINRSFQSYLAGFPPVRRQDVFVTKIMKIPPVANFTGTPQTGCSPLTVNFTDTSTNSPTSWLWDFGNGNTSPEQNPQAIFINPDPVNPVNFTINLTACNEDGCGFISKYNYTKVCPHLFWDFIANQSRGCVGTNATIQFNGVPAAPINTSTWYFDFGDGTIGVPGVTFIHTYTAPAAYNVSLWVENECCNNTTLKLEFVDIRQTPVADFFANVTRGLSPLNVHFTDNSSGRPETWQWNFGAGQGPNSTLQNPDHTYLSKGRFTVNLTVCNFCGCDGDSQVRLIRVGDPNLTYLPASLVVPTNDTTPIDLYLERADNGLSGFDLNIFWDDTIHGNITSVKFPSWVDSPEVIGTLPGSIAQIRGYDNNEQVPIPATNLILATINLTGLTPTGPGGIKFNVTANELDDIDGFPIYVNELPADITVVRLLPFPGKVNASRDPDGDQVYWDVNGNGRIDFNDVTTYYQNMQWIRINQYIPFFDYNKNGLIDFADLILLFQHV